MLEVIFISKEAKWEAHLNYIFKIQDSRFKFIKTKWQQSLNYMVIYNYKTLKITKSVY